MPNESTPLPLESIARVFVAHGVEFIVIGGQAETLMGSPRVTFDTDLCYRRTSDNIQRLASALTELRVALRDAPSGLPFKPDARTIEAGLNFTLTSTFGDLDLLGEVEPIGTYDEIVRRAETYAIEALTVQTISLDDLIRVKQHIRRSKDVDSLQQLLAIKRERERGTPH